MTSHGINVVCTYGLLFVWTCANMNINNAETRNPTCITVACNAFCIMRKVLHCIKQ
jgi:hypothetical protein